MCSGRVDLEFIFRAFSNGIDGVFIGGCRLGECNYVTHGNYHALNVVLLAKRIMEHIGLNPDRLRIEFMSSGEGILFAEVVDDFTRQIKKLGPLGEKEGIAEEDLKAKIEGVERLIPYIKIAEKDKLGSHLQKEEEYDLLFSRDEIEKLFTEAPSYYIDPQKCQGCMICLRRCPVEAIDGGKKIIHIIDQDKCIKCGTCYEACPPRFGAVQKIVGGEAPPPVPEEKRKVANKK